MDDFLALTLAGRLPHHFHGQTAHFRWHWIDCGILQLIPHEPCDRSLVLSSGLHGNETAPIELLDRLLQAIASGQLQPRTRLLLLLGNPQAMRRGERFRVRRIWRNVAAAAAVVLLAAGWRWQARWNVRQDWKTILGLAVVVCALTQAVYIATAKLYGPENSIHIEVLLPAFVVGMLMKHKHID